MLDICEPLFCCNLTINHLAFSYDSLLGYLATDLNDKRFLLTTAIEKTPGSLLQKHLVEEFACSCTLHKKVASITGNQIYAAFSLESDLGPYQLNAVLQKLIQAELSVASQGAVAWRRIPEPDSASMPSILWNRFDIRFGRRAEWYEICNNEQKGPIGVVVEKDHVRVGILFIPFRPAELNSFFSYLFDLYPNVKFISYQYSEFSMINAWNDIRERESWCYSLPLGRSFGEVFLRSKKKTRYNILRSHRLLEEAVGHLIVREYSADKCPTKVREQYLQLKQAAFDLSEDERSFNSIIHSNKLPVTHVYTLEVESGLIISILLNAEQCQTACLVNMAFDQKYSRYSPGILLYVEVIRKLIEKQKSQFYLGSGDYHYKKLFGSQRMYYWVGDVLRHDY